MTTAADTEHATRMRRYWRQRLRDLVDGSNGETYAALSRWLGRRDGYLARYASGGPPATLTPADVAQLARYFGIDPRELGEP